MSSITPPIPRREGLLLNPQLEIFLLGCIQEAPAVLLTTTPINAGIIGMCGMTDTKATDLKAGQATHAVVEVSKTIPWHQSRLPFTLRPDVMTTNMSLVKPEGKHSITDEAELLG